MVAGIAYEGESDLRIVDLPLESVPLPLGEISLNVELLVARVDEFDLLPLRLGGGHLQSPSQAVCQRQGWLDVPAIAKVNVVIGDRALVVCRSKRRVQGKIGTGAGVGDLRVGDYAGYRGEVPRGRAARRITRSRHTRHVD